VTEEKYWIQAALPAPAENLDRAAEPRNRKTPYNYLQKFSRGFPLRGGRYYL
jgi:hypothetical protein